MHVVLCNISKYFPRFLCSAIISLAYRLVTLYKTLRKLQIWSHSRKKSLMENLLYLCSAKQIAKYEKLSMYGRTQVIGNLCVRVCVYSLPP